MKIIDTHSHIFPPKIERVATDAIREFYDREVMAHDGSVEELLTNGKAAGVDKFVIFSTATTPQQVQKINDFILEECEKHPEFIGAGTMHRDFENPEAEVVRIFESGMRGIKLHPDFQKFNLDDRLLFPTFDALQQRDMYIVTHSGDYRYDFSHPERIANVARNFPKLHIIAAHMGGWSMWDIGRELLAPLENVFVDSSSTYGFAGTDPIVRGISAFGYERVFFGCDFPMWRQDTELEMLRSLGLSEKELESILGGNFINFYSRYDIAI